ncbi:MAG: 1-deoxy-D-xylulose-5-phosphate synthase [Chloroflexi bacterium]|nr:1-deoxy-D-xylulose-5-phosphate synthase [Chloroflexota bacterium]
MGGILERINQPSDLRNLTMEELRRLAGEVREELVSIVTQTGGHLASNLGAVELTIALHRTFDSPTDKIVWDVGHQSYTHKLLTGRRQRFSTLRQYDGLAGFPMVEESPHDVFGTGHAGTSVSAALGMALARDLAAEKFHVVAVIGDGAMTAGLALEALNHAGHLGTRVIVVLNDNKMSISPNVGAVSHSLNKLRLHPRYHRAKEEAEQVLTKLPLGLQFLETGKRLKKGVKGWVIPTMIWEELGFTYMGPVDGHNIADLLAAFTQAKAYSSKPTFVHVITRKGKGYEPAEEDAVGFHGVSPNGAKMSAPSYTKVFGQTALRLARENPRIVAITAAMMDNTGLTDMSREFPKRVFDVGICEQHAVTMAAGMASQGLVPIVAIYSTFLQRAYDQILHDVCMQRLPVVFTMDRGGIVGEDGRTHQGVFDLSYLRSIPNMVVAAPKDENELQHLLFTAVQARCPFAIRYPRGSGEGVVLDEELRALAVGRGEILHQGDDVAILALGTMVTPSLEAASMLSREGIQCTVVNVRFVKPLDEDLIISLARRTSKVLTVEDNIVAGGLGSAVLELLATRAVEDVRVGCIGIPDHFVEHGDMFLLRRKYGLDTQGIVRRVMEAFPSFQGLPVKVWAANK